MSKYRTTKKSIKEDYTHILGTGYCNLQNLLRAEEPFAYSTRAEGWLEAEGARWTDGPDRTGGALAIQYRLKAMVKAHRP